MILSVTYKIHVFVCAFQAWDGINEIVRPLDRNKSLFDLWQKLKSDVLTSRKKHTLICKPLDEIDCDVLTHGGNNKNSVDSMESMDSMGSMGSVDSMDSTDSMDSMTQWTLWTPRSPSTWNRFSFPSSKKTLKPVCSIPRRKPISCSSLNGKTVS